MAPLDDLFWFPLEALYAEISSANAATRGELLVELERRRPWLLEGVAKFRPPSEASAQLVAGSRVLAFAQGKAAVEPRLVPATEHVSRLLQLDQVQAHVLLKRELRRELGAEPPGAPLQLSARQLGAVASSYFSERLFLLKALQLLLLAGAPGAEGAEQMAPLARSLLQAGLEERLVGQLRTALQPQAPAAARAGQPGSAAAASPELHAWLEAQRAEQRLREAAELLAALALLYGALAVPCPAERFLELAQLCGAALFAGPHAGAPPAAGGRGAGGGGGGGGLALAQHLACLCLLAGMQLPGLLAALSQPGGLSQAQAQAQAQAQGQGQGQAQGQAHLASRAREIHEALGAWAAGPSCALLLLAWTAYCRLLQQCLERPPALSLDELQHGAMAAGGLGAAAAALRHEGLRCGGPTEGLARSQALAALAACAAAFDLGPAALDLGVFDGLVALLGAALEGGPPAAGWLGCCVASRARPPALPHPQPPSSRRRPAAQPRPPLPPQARPSAAPTCGTRGSSCTRRSGRCCSRRPTCSPPSRHPTCA
jgi:hypothetical protein